MTIVIALSKQLFDLKEVKFSRKDQSFLSCWLLSKLMKRIVFPEGKKIKILTFFFEEFYSY